MKGRAVQLDQNGTKGACPKVSHVSHTYIFVLLEDGVGQAEALHDGVGAQVDHAADLLGDGGV